MSSTVLPVLIPAAEPSAVTLPTPFSNGIFAKAAEVSPALIAVFKKPSFAVVYLNGTARRWLDPRNESSLDELTLSEVIGIGSLDRFQNDILLQAGVRGKWTGECSLRDVWGSEIPVHASLTSHAGGLLCLQAAPYANVGPADNRFTSDQDLLHALLETLPDAVYFKDLHSRFVRVSRALANKDGCNDPSELIGRTDFDRFTAEHARPAFEDEQRIIRTGEPIFDLEEKETWPDGRVSWVSTTKLPLRNREGRIVGTFGVSRDIGARKLAEQENRDLLVQLQLAQRLESIGRLAAGVAHEINTPTQFITDNTRFLATAFSHLTAHLDAHRKLREAAANHPNLAELAIAAGAVEQEQEFAYLLGEIPNTITQTLGGLDRVARIVRSLKEFSHPGNAERTPVDLNHVIEVAINVSRHEWKYVAEVVTDFDAALPAVPCVVDEFNQVVLNLLINAAHAIESILKTRSGGPAHGTITVRTRHDSENAFVEIEDTGAGIPEDIRPRIFDPFFTTKEVGKGTGQGLAIVRTVVVKHHHGTVDFTSEVGRGTTFRLRLPLSAPILETSAQ